MAEVRTLVFNVFVSSAKCVRLQRKMRSSPVPSVHLLASTKARSLLAINEFVCNVISCSEESSRGYLVTSDDAFVCSVISYFEVK